MGLQEQAPFNFIDGETTESFIEEGIIFNSDGVGTFANEGMIFKREYVHNTKFVFINRFSNILFLMK